MSRRLSIALSRVFSRAAGARISGKLLTAVTVVVLALSFALPLAADDEQANAKAAEKPPEKTAEKPPEPLKFARQHHMKLGGADVGYTTTAEEIFIKDADGKNTASFFTIAYTKDGVTRPEERPIAFVYNGGPGSASVWLHFGLVGPKVVDIPSDAQDPGAPPYRLRDNEATIFRATDLVFVDPVGTGYSRAMGDKKNADFWGYDEDADSVAEFIRTYVTQHNRWNSPKYLLGESYGGVRSALLLPRLANFGIGVNGVVLISPALNLGTLPFVVSGNDLTFATHLPALAATAYYHKKLPDQWKDQDTLLREVEAFAGNEYLVALFQGDSLPRADRERIAERLHRYTGLSKDYIMRANLRINALRFTKELLRDEGKSLGLLDGRYVENELDRVAEFPDSDAFNSKTTPIYISLFQSYLRNDLGVDLVKEYYGSNGEANQKWKRPANGRNLFAGFVDVTTALAQATKDSEALRVFAAAGYNDLTTSYFALRYMLEHSGIDADRLTIRDYAGGHMMYLHRPSQEALSNDIVAFINEGSATRK